MPSDDTKYCPDRRHAAGHQPGATVSVLLPLPLAGAYDYTSPDNMTLNDGQFVTVPFGQRELIGVVWGAGRGEIAKSRLKTVSSQLVTPPLGDEIRQFIDWVAAYTVSAPGAVLKMVMSVPDALTPAKPVRAYILPSGILPPGGEGGSPAIKMTPARQRVLDCLAGGPPRTGADLAREAAVSPSVVKGLADAGVIRAHDLAADTSTAVPDPRRPGPKLSPEQTAAADGLVASIEAGGFGVTLLDGVPGSGKTEVYFQAVAAAIEQGRQVLVLLPEIALSAQWLSRFEARFGCQPAVWHSDITAARRRTTWRAVARGQVPVVVGARSALFLPYPDLGLIVVDEEHEAAFKQEDGVIYNARDMAVVRASLGGFQVVLASATPSLETVANVARGRYQSRHLADRHGGALMPEIKVIDLRATPPPRGAWLSPKLRDAVKQTLAAGEQVMLYLNRRGYAPLTLCRTCGYRLACPNCTAWLVAHQRSGRLRCHHCGYWSPPPAQCPECETADNFAACGPGVERLAEEAADIFPDARQLIAASDTVSGPVAAAEMVRQIEDREVDLVIGTQIIAKGYHFPGLTLVGVVDADLGLTGGDLRAAERTYQMLYQVAGRAGRGEVPGRVMLQTYMPDHPVMAALASGERDRFIAAETDARKSAGMPPYGRLAALIVSGVDEGAVERIAQHLARQSPRGNGVDVFGPAPAPLAILRGRHRRRLLLKAPRNTNISAIVSAWVSGVKRPRNVRIQVDIDPYGFL